MWTGHLSRTMRNVRFSVFGYWLILQSKSVHLGLLQVTVIEEQYYCSSVPGLSRALSAWRSLERHGGSWEWLVSNFYCVKREKHVRFKKFLYSSPPPKCSCWCLVSVYGASPSVYPPMSLWLSSWLSPLLPKPSPPYAVPSPLSYSSDFLGERKSSSWSFMSSIFMYLAPSVPKNSSPSENNMPNRANRPWSGWWNTTREREKEKKKID